MLSNEKYSGDVIIFKTYNSGPNRKINNIGERSKYLSTANHPAIIVKETFAAVQEERARRSNIVKGENGTTRKSTRYSSKKTTQDNLVLDEN